MTNHITNMTFMNTINDFYELTLSEIYWILIVVNKFPVHLSFKQVKKYD